MPSIKTTIDIGVINTELNTLYNKKAIKDDFLQKITTNRDFIEQGLSITENNKCPYCEQSLNGAEELIIAYNDFFDATQHTVSQKLSDYKKHFENLENSLKTSTTDSNQYLKQFNELKGYFPLTKNAILNPIVSPEGMSDAIMRCKNAIDNKIADISKTDINITDVFNIITQGIATINSQIEEFNKKIESVNSSKYKSKEEGKKIKQNLCKVTFNEIVINNKTEIDKYTSNIKLIQEATKELSALQPKQKIKDCVYKTFCSLIEKYFSKKYNIEKDTFKLKLRDQHLEKPDMVLSDGEKNIIAFCYYLANVHSKIATTSDYNNLFFIIDDPISSLDFNYVYETTQIIKNLSEIIERNKAKFIILTHNTEFMNLLCRNKIVSKAYFLKKGEPKISKLNHAFVAPYQNHLEDIIKISKGCEKPVHTTYNSIRHILECIMSFTNPTCNKLDTFINTQKINGTTLFDNNGHIKRIIQDMSHGQYRSYTEIDEEKTIDGCKELINYINEYFPGQIPHLTS